MKTFSSEASQETGWRSGLGPGGEGLRSARISFSKHQKVTEETDPSGEGRSQIWNLERSLW